MPAINNPASSPDPGVPSALPTTPEERPGKSKKIVFFLALIAVGAGILYFLNSLEKKKAQAAAAAQATVTRVTSISRGDIEVKLRLNGVTTARNSVVITAPRLRGRGLDRGMNILKLAPAGKFVKKGDVVAELDAQTLRDRIDDDVATLRDRENEVEKRKVQLELDMENLRQSLRVAKAEMDKARLDLKASEIRTPVDREILTLAVEEAEARHKQLSADVAQKELSQKADLRITEINYILQKRDVDKLLRDLERFVFHAPMDGMVVMMTNFRPGGDQQQIQEGDTVNPGQPFMRIVDTSSMQVEGTINQTESSLFRIGQQASVGLDAFPGAQFPAKVFSIGALAAGGWRQQYYVRNVPVRVEMLKVDTRVIPDLSASADVALEREENVLIAPASAVVYEKGKPVVYVKSANGFERRDVQVGLNNGQQIALLDGVKEGEQVRYN